MACVMLLVVRGKGGFGPKQGKSHENSDFAIPSRGGGGALPSGKRGTLLILGFPFNVVREVEKMNKEKRLIVLLFLIPLSLLSGCTLNRFFEVTNGYDEPLLVNWETGGDNASRCILPGKCARERMGLKMFSISTARGTTWHYGNRDVDLMLESRGVEEEEFWEVQNALWIWANSTIRLYIDNQGYLWVTSDKKPWHEVHLQPSGFPAPPVGMTAPTILSPLWTRGDSPLEDDTTKNDCL